MGCQQQPSLGYNRTFRASSTLQCHPFLQLIFQTSTETFHTPSIDSLRSIASLVLSALFRTQLVDVAREVCLGRERIFQLETEVQSMRSSPPQVVERADPGTFVETMRLRDKVAAREEQARRAQRAAAEAQEVIGRESAINQVNILGRVEPSEHVC